MILFSIRFDDIHWSVLLILMVMNMIRKLKIPNFRNKYLQITEKKSNWYLRNGEGIENCEEVIVKVKEGRLVGLGRRVGESVSAIVGRDGP